MSWLSDLGGYAAARWGRGGPFGTIAGALNGNTYNRKVLGESIGDIGDAIAPFTGYWAPLVAGGANAIGDAIEPGTNFGDIAKGGLTGAAEGYLGAGAIGGAEAANAAGSGLGGTIWGGVKGLGGALGIPTGSTPASIGAGLPAGADSTDTASSILSGASSPTGGVGVTPGATPGAAPGVSSLSDVMNGGAIAGAPSGVASGATGGATGANMGAVPFGMNPDDATGGASAESVGSAGSPTAPNSSFLSKIMKQAGPIGQGVSQAVNTAENAQRVGVMKGQLALQQQQYADEKKRQQQVAAYLQPLYAQLMGQLQAHKTS